MFHVKHVAAPQPSEAPAAPDASAAPTATHVAYADETQYNVGRYRGLGMVSLRATNEARLTGELRALLAASGGAELKWEKAPSARARLVATQALTWTVERATEDALRVDTLTWDTGDAAQMGRGEPYLRVLRRMYTRLLVETLPRHWSGEPAARWRSHPDAQDALDWPHIIAAAPHILSLTPLSSAAHPLIQLANLFAGLAVFSRSAYDVYEAWLIDPQAAPSAYSGSLRQRLQLLDEFYTLTKLHSLGISLRSQRGLKTYDPRSPLLFAW